jgi:hypothetical protein
MSMPSLSLSVPLQRALWAVAGLSLLLRLFISATFPITGDEAFFYWWGVYPDWGYYDHPPMVGWFIAAMLQLFGDTTWSIRLPIVLLPLVQGLVLWWGVAAWDRERAPWAALLFWLTPLNWINTLITTDTPLMLWSMLSIACLMHAEARARMDGRTWTLYALSGLFIGYAFLSKYFSVVLGLSYLVYFALVRRERWAGMLVLVLAALPGPAINVWWNMGHGWSNIMFNVYNRNQGEVFGWHKPGLYLLTWAYLLTPGVLWLGVKHRAGLRDAWSKHRLLACLTGVPVAFFALLSLKKVIGLHWVLSFYPLMFASLALALPREALPRAGRYLAVFLGLHLLVVGGMYTRDLADWKDVKIYPEIVRSYRTEALLEQVKTPDAVIMATAYTPAAIYGHALKHYVPVFGLGKFHARQDDLLVDYARFDGKTIRIISFSRPELPDYAPYFQQVTLLDMSQSGAQFFVVEGQGFRYELYRQQVLGEIFRRYYNIPAWLPMTGCPFCERYCGQVRCPRPEGDTR